MGILFGNSLTHTLPPSLIKENGFNAGETILIECPHTLNSDQKVERFKFRIALSLKHKLIPLLSPEHLESDHSNSVYKSYAKYTWSWSDEEIEHTQGIHSTLNEELRNITPSKDLIGLFTSGSSGSPKLIWHSIDHYEHAALRSAKLLGISRDKTLLSALPCYHNGGFLNLVRADLYNHKLTIVSHHDLVKNWKEHSPDFIVGVPTQLQQGLNSIKNIKGQTFYCGGAALDHELWKDALTAGMRVLATYGLTESCGAILYKLRPDDLYQCLEGVKASVSPAGTLQFICPSNAHAIQNELGLNLGSSPWITADRASLGPQGQIQILGRNDDMIICSGENIDPKEIEIVTRAFLKSQAITTQIQVIGMPDAIKGSIPILMIEALELWKDAQRDELIQYLRTHLSPLKKPRFLMHGIFPERGIKITPEQVRANFDKAEIGVWKV